MKHERGPRFQLLGAVYQSPLMIVIPERRYEDVVAEILTLKLNDEARRREAQKKR
jgi:hypothetical protein